jgi:hypothetical protein
MIERKKVEIKDRCFFMQGEVKTFTSQEIPGGSYSVKVYVYLDGELIEIDEKLFRYQFDINQKLHEERDDAVSKLDAIRRVLGITEDDE